jgi:hypothetical protein
VKAYVVVDSDGDPWLSTLQGTEEDAVDVMMEQSLQSWESLKSKGFKVEACYIGPEDLQRQIDEACALTESASNLKELAAGCIEGAYYKDLVETAHVWIRHALGLGDSAPRRFDYYAQKIEELKG